MSSNKYLFTFTPTLCTFHWIGRVNPNGTYKFNPNAYERGLVSFAVSRLDFSDTMPESVLERYARENGLDQVVVCKSSQGYYLGGTGPLMLEEGRPIKPIWL